MTSTVPWDLTSVWFEEEEVRSIILVPTPAMDYGASSMHQKNTGYGLFSVSSRQAKPIALLNTKGKSEFSMILSDVFNALDDMLFIDALEGTSHMVSTTTVKCCKGAVDAMDLGKGGKLTWIQSLKH
eukprot:11851384-Ditylum_brightwellii.AAC.1